MTSATATIRAGRPHALLLLGLGFALSACGGSGEAPADQAADKTPEAPAPAQEAAAAGPSLEELANGAHRAEGNAERNRYRHPVATLEFFGLEPEHHVVEIWPGRGWYTEIIAPYVNERGRYIAAHYDPDAEREYFRKALVVFNEKLEAHPELYGNAEVTVLMPPDTLDLGPEGEADMVLTFRNVHNWMFQGQAEAVFDAMFAALKPGGVLGVVEHRADPDSEPGADDRSGYVREDHTIALAEAAGFVLEASSEINANPADTKDYPDGVWTLPPSLRLGDEDRDKYLAIGESDRFTLKFRKPD